jgi:hypothetical protein
MGYLYGMKYLVLTVILFLQPGFHWVLCGQPEVFTRDDFELRGPVKACTILTDYGEELFEFDREGRLLKSVTRYSDSDYDVTYYRYEGGRLGERRDEVYRGSTFEKQTSFARFYERDTLKGIRVVEKILSYDQQIQEQITYQFDRDTLLRRIVRIHDEGIDETLLEYTEKGNEKTTNYYLNGQLQKSVRNSVNGEGPGALSVCLVREYFKGAPQRAVEQTRDASGKLVRETRFTYDVARETFRKAESFAYGYNADGLVGQQTTSSWDLSGNPRVQEKAFLYQMDGRDPGNWIKKIVTPENTFVTRKLSYYPGEASPPKK